MNLLRMRIVLGGLWLLAAAMSVPVRNAASPRVGAVEQTGACCDLDADPFCYVGPAAWCQGYYLGDGTDCSSCVACRVDPPFVDFGGVPIGQSADRIIKLFMLDQTQLPTTITSSCGRVSLFPSSVVIPPQDSVFVTVRFSPTLEDTILVELDTGCPQSVWVMGSGSVATDAENQVGSGVAQVLDIAPNPSFGATNIRFLVNGSRSQFVKLEVFSVAGRRVHLSSRVYPPGPARVVWDGLDQRGRQASAGVYRVRVTIAGKRTTRPLVLIR